MFALINRKGSPRKRQRPQLQPRLEGLEGRAPLSQAGNLLRNPATPTVGVTAPDATYDGTAHGATASSVTGVSDVVHLLRRRGHQRHQPGRDRPDQLRHLQRRPGRRDVTSGTVVSGHSIPGALSRRPPPPPPAHRVFFDDFRYMSASDRALAAFGWTPRSGTGGPGGGTWSPSNVTFVSGVPGSANTVLRLGVSIAASNKITQAELDYNKINMFKGTYAARVYFTDVQDTGSSGAHVVEAPFWTMSNYATTSGTNKYSEDDFEYLPNGGWGTSVPTMHNTTWYNDRRGISIDTVTKGSFAGWHTLLITVSGGHVKYYVENQDGVTATLLADHSTNKGINYYPRSPMAIIPQLWLYDNHVTSTWHVDVDWLYYAQNPVLTAAQVEANVKALQASGIPRQNTVR